MVVVVESEAIRGLGMGWRRAIVGGLVEGESDDGLIGIAS